MPDLLDSINQSCLDQINSLLDEPLKSDRLEFYTWKRMISIRDIDVYHSVASALKSSPRQRGSDLDFIAEMDGRSWTIVLPGAAREFMDRYGL
jgi:hypothetical protein